MFMCVYVHVAAAWSPASTSRTSVIHTESKKFNTPFKKTDDSSFRTPVKKQPKLAAASSGEAHIFSDT